MVVLRDAKDQAQVAPLFFNNSNPQSSGHFSQPRRARRNNPFYFMDIWGDWFLIRIYRYAKNKDYNLIYYIFPFITKLLYTSQKFSFLKYYYYHFITYHVV